MRSELIKKLFAAYAEGDREKFLKISEEIINEEERKNHHLLAKELRKILFDNEKYNNRNYAKRYKANIPIPRDSDRGFPLLEIKEYYFTWDDVILPDHLKSKLKLIVEEINQKEVLASYGLRPKQKLLFCGPPGTGKTLTSKVLSSVLKYPLVYVRFDSIVSSYLGETATNLRKIFDFIEHGQWVVLFDEFDIVGKHRDDPHEHGEIKRIVNNFMQMLDNYKGSSLIIAATNHQHLLDPALWRRFDEILFFDLPDEQRRRSLFRQYLRVLETKKIDFDTLSKKTEGFSGSDISQVCEEALRKAILEGRRYIDMKYLNWAIDEQIRRMKIKGRK